MTDPRPLLIVDGDNLAHRAYHSTPKSFPHNAVTGFFGMLFRIVSEEDPRGVFVAWDTLGVDTYRNKLWPAYQSGRVFDREIVEQLALLPRLCASCGMGLGKQREYEADDLMASAVKADGGRCLLLTTDRDAYQLVSDKVQVLAARRGSRALARVGPAEVVRELGVLPEQVPDYKALAGDSSDKIPGIRGIGPKSASALLLKYGSLERVVEGWPEPEAARAMMFRDIATMRDHLEVRLPASPPDWEAGATSLRELGLDSLAERLTRSSTGTSR